MKSCNRITTVTGSFKESKFLFFRFNTDFKRILFCCLNLDINISYVYWYGEPTPSKTEIWQGKCLLEPLKRLYVLNRISKLFYCFISSLWSHFFATNVNSSTSAIGWEISFSRWFHCSILKTYNKTSKTLSHPSSKLANFHIIEKPGA